MDNTILKKLHTTQLEILDEVVRICNKNDIDYFLCGGTLLGAVRHNGFIPWDDDIDIGMTRKDFKNFIQVCKNDLNNSYILEYKDTNSNYYLNFAKIMIKDTIFDEGEKENYEGEKGIFLDIFPFDNSDKECSFKQLFQSIISNFIRSTLYYKVGCKSPNKIKNIPKKIFSVFNNSLLLNIQEKVMTLNKNDNSRYLTAFSGTYSYKKDTYERNKTFPLKKIVFEGKEYKVPKEYKYYLKKLYGDYMKLPPIENRKTHNPKRIKFLGEEIIEFDN